MCGQFEPPSSPCQFTDKINFVIHTQSAMQIGDIAKLGSLLLTPSLTSAGLSENLAGRGKKIRVLQEINSFLKVAAK